MPASISSEDVATLLLWTLVILALIVILIVAAIVLAKAYRRSATRSGDSAWTLEDLDRLHREGRLTDGEYRVLRRSMIEALRAGIRDEDRGI